MPRTRFRSAEEGVQRQSPSWRGGLRLLGGGASMNFVAEVNAEQQQGDVSLGGRLGLTLDF